MPSAYRRYKTYLRNLRRTPPRRPDDGFLLHETMTPAAFVKRKTKHRRMLSSFVRLPNRKKVLYAADFEAAGYPHANIGSANWADVHAFCESRFRQPGGHPGYCWTGNVFWFLTPDDRDAMLAHLHEQDRENRPSASPEDRFDGREKIAD